MNKDKYVFAQLVEFLDSFKFRRIVAKYNGDRYVKHLTWENAVRIQIYVAISTYLLVSIVKHDMQLGRSIYEVLQILSISLTDKTRLKDLFDKTKFQYDKEPTDPNGQNLFNV